MYITVRTYVIKSCCYIDMLLLQGGNTALHSACINGHVEVLKYLLSNNADIEATSNVSNYCVYICSVIIVYNCELVQTFLRIE